MQACSGQPFHAGLEKRAVDDQLTVGRRTGRAGSLLPSGPSKSYSFPPPATASAGARRPTRRGRASIPFPHEEPSRAVSHSFSDTTFGVFMSDVRVCVLIFAFRSSKVQRTDPAVPDAYFCLPETRRGDHALEERRRPAQGW
jgi:hypothetical protein